MRALLVTYSFPPVSSAGVWRVLKLAKYLPEHGVRPAILTVENPSVPHSDESLVAGLSPELEILRARTLEPGYALKQAAWSEGATSGRRGLVGRARGALLSAGKAALFPDPQVLWLPYAGAALRRRLAEGVDDVVFISAPPFSQLLLAPLVRSSRRPALVFDYRDEWLTYRNTYEMMGGLGKLLGGPLERSLLKRADAVTTATEAFRANLLDQFPFLSPEQVIAIPNGFDPDDLPAELPEPPKDRFVITYAGTVFRLTSPRGFLAALRIVHEREPELASTLDVRFYGRIVDTEAPLFADAEELGIRLHGYVDKETVLRAQAESHLVLCTLDEVEGAESIYPGKNL